MMSALYEIDYVLESPRDWVGEFPLQCAALLFDMLGVYSNVVIRNKYAIKKEKAEIISKYVDNTKNLLCECPKCPEGNYAIWLKHGFVTNQEIIDILGLQGTYLSYIVPSDSFNWEKFSANWKDDEHCLILSGEAVFVCNIVDMERTLNINFNTENFPIKRITTIISKWEQKIKQLDGTERLVKTTVQEHSKYGNKQLIRLKFS